MEKKVRYLMLVLCLFLFPIRVFAQEEIPTENIEVNESSTIVAKLDNNNQEGQINNTQDSQKTEQQEMTQETQQDETQEADEISANTTPVEEPTEEETQGADETSTETTPVEETTEDETQGVDETSADTTSEEETTEDETSTDTTIGEETTNDETSIPGENGESSEEPSQNEEDSENGEEEPGEGEEEETDPNVDTNAEDVQTIIIKGVDTQLKVGETIKFTGESAEPEKYTIVREEWTTWSSYDEAYKRYRITSDEEYNNTNIPETERIDKVLSGKEYTYSVVVRFNDGYEFKYTTVGEDEFAYQYAVFNINEVSLEHGYISYTYDNNDYLFGTGYTVEAYEENTNYVDLNLTNVNNEANVGETPTYSAETDNSHFKVAQEVWYWIEESYDESQDMYTYYYHINTNGEYELQEGEVWFDTFEANAKYDHLIVIESENGYLVNSDGGDGMPTYHILVDGKEVDGYIFRSKDSTTNKDVYTVVYSGIDSVDKAITNTTEEPVAATTTNYNTTYNTSEEPVVTQLDTTDKKEKDSKLEVKEDEKEKTDKKEVKEDKNNTGLIIFLIILVIIAIAIPVTVYKKKQ